MYAIRPPVRILYTRRISKFYPSIRHDILKAVIRHKIKDNEVLNLLDDIIDSTHTEKNVPIGNFLSQWFGNLVLNEFAIVMTSSFLATTKQR